MKNLKIFLLSFLSVFVINLSNAEIKGTFDRIKKIELTSNKGIPSKILNQNITFKPKNVKELIIKGYDSEIEYLQSNGSQWIDTGIVPNHTTPFSVKFQNDNINGNSPGYGNVLGARLSSSSQELQVGQYSNGLVSIGTRNADVGLHSTDIQTAVFNGNKTVTINGTNKNITTSEFTTYKNTIVLFGIRNNNTVTQLQAGRIYNFTWDVEHDFVPVRVGTTGYMYDKITGKLFGNKGSGSFTCGPDKIDYWYWPLSITRVSTRPETVWTPATNIWYGSMAHNGYANKSSGATQQSFTYKSYYNYNQGGYSMVQFFSLPAGDYELCFNYICQLASDNALVYLMKYIRSSDKYVHNGYLTKTMRRIQYSKYRTELHTFTVPDDILLGIYITAPNTENRRGIDIWDVHLYKK